MNSAAKKATLLKTLDGLEKIPTIPAVLAPLLNYLQEPADSIDMQKVADLISRDESLAAQCLRMANSPLFGHAKKMDSLRGAVLGLGFERISTIAMSCGILNILPRDRGIDPAAFWEHSLGCALVSRHFASKISFPDPAKAYLAGLLHDLGFVINLLVLPGEFRAAYEFAREAGVPLHEAEQSMLGFTHCDSGRWLAERWQLAPELIEVVGLHHSPQEPRAHAGLVALVEVSDQLCRVGGLNYGYIEKREVNFSGQNAVAVLAQQCHELNDFDWARLTFELDSRMDEVRSLVHAIYRS